MKLSDHNMFVGLDGIYSTDKKAICESCVMGKQHRLPYPKSSSTGTTDVLELVHSDVCGPMNTPPVGGSMYFVTFIDDFK